MDLWIAVYQNQPLLDIKWPISFLRKNACFCALQCICKSGSDFCKLPYWRSPRKMHLMMKCLPRWLTNVQYSSIIQVPWLRDICSCIQNEYPWGLMAYLRLQNFIETVYLNARGLKIMQLRKNARIHTAQKEYQTMTLPWQINQALRIWTRCRGVVIYDQVRWTNCIIGIHTWFLVVKTSSRLAKELLGGWVVSIRAVDKLARLRTEW
jgi:hypothetical protein